MSDRAPRDDWGQVFRDAVSKGRGLACIILLGAMVMIGRSEGMAQWFALVVGLAALAAVFPKSPVIAYVIQKFPGLPTKGESS